MINIFYDTTQKITFYLKPSLSNPVYLFSMVNYTTRERLNFISAELSNGSDLLQFSVTEVGEGAADLLNGIIDVKNFGRYTVEVYEQVSTTNLDETLATFLGDDELIAHKPVIFDYPPVRNPLEPSTSCTLQVTASIVDETTAGANDGEATANDTGGQGIITYLWSTVDGNIPAGEEIKKTATGLSVGTYTVVVSDDIETGCTATDSGEVETAPACGISIDNLIMTSASSPIATDGTATVTTSGVTSVGYLWSDGQTTQTATGLGIGEITVTVFDLDITGCAAAQEIEITSAFTADGWWRGDESTSINAGSPSISDPVDSWGNLSGNTLVNDATQSTPASRPTWEGTYLQATGSQWLSLGLCLSKMADRTMLIVYQPDAVASYSIMGDSTSTGASAGVWITSKWNGGGTGGLYGDGTNDRRYSSTTTPGTAITSYSERYASGETLPEIRIGGNAEVEINVSGAATSIGGTPTEFSFFRTGTHPALMFSGKIFEIIILSRKASEAEFTAMNTYATTKYSL